MNILHRYYSTEVPVSKMVEANNYNPSLLALIQNSWSVHCVNPKKP